MDQYADDDILDTAACADIAQKNRRTIIEWIKAGWLPATRGPGARSQYRILYSDLKHLITPRKVEPHGLQERVGEDPRIS